MLLNAINSSLAGLQTAAKQANTSAQNIAQIGTGVSTTPVDVVDIGSNDLTTDLINLKIAELSYKANAKALQVNLDLSKELLNSFDKSV